MKRVLIAAALVGSILTGCALETNDETLTAFNAGQAINCKTGIFRGTYNIVTNADHKYNTRLMLFIGEDGDVFNMHSCYSRY